MKRLEIDFTGRVRRSPWVGRALFAAALVLTLDAGLSYREATNRVEQAAASARAQPRQAPGRKLAPEELAAVRETVERLALPWDRLFAALESASSDKVALLGIEPDAKAGTVVISGDSKDYLATLTYVLALSQNQALERVQLVRHEVKAEDPQAPVSFAVSAAWNGARP